MCEKAWIGEISYDIYASSRFRINMIHFQIPDTRRLETDTFRYTVVPLVDNAQLNSRCYTWDRDHWGSTCSNVDLAIGLLQAALTCLPRALNLSYPCDGCSLAFAA